MRGSPRGEKKFESLFSVAKFLKAYLCLRLGMARKTIEDHLDVIVNTCPHDGRKSNFFLRTLNLTFLPNLLVISHLIFRQKMRERRRIQTGNQFSRPSELLLDSKRSVIMAAMGNIVLCQLFSEQSLQ